MVINCFDIINKIRNFRFAIIQYTWIFVAASLYYAWRVSNRPHLSRPHLYVTALRSSRLIGARIRGICIFATVIYTVLHISVATWPSIVTSITHVTPIITIVSQVSARAARGTIDVPFRTSHIIRERKITISVILAGKTVLTIIIKISILLSKIFCRSKIISTWIWGKITTSKIVLIWELCFSTHIWMSPMTLTKITTIISRICVRMACLIGCVKQFY